MRAPGMGIPVSRSEKPRRPRLPCIPQYGYNVPQTQPATPMPSFDFISTKDIRESLENDFREMSESSTHGNFKSTLVMAGSIIEGLLVDYLVTFPNAARKAKKGPLELHLSEAIEICVEEKVLTKGTAELCTVVKSFRNLIHPGLLTRLGEPAPDENSAVIAVALVKRIVGELEIEFRKRTGLSAEQVVTKVENDPHATGLIEHLLRDLREDQRRRLLLELIPARYQYWIDAQTRNPGGDDDQTADDLVAVHRAALKGGNVETQKLVAAEFYRILKEGDGDAVKRHTYSGLFVADDLKYLPKDRWPHVTAHLLSKVGPAHVTLRTLAFTRGICPFLASADAHKWLDPLIKGAVLGNTIDPAVDREIRDQILRSGFDTGGEFDRAVVRRFNEWIHSVSQSHPDLVERVTELRDSVVGL